MFKIKILGMPTTRTGTNARGPWSIKEQPAVAYLGDFQERCKLTLADSFGGHQVGAEFEVDITSIRVNDYGGFEFARDLVLKPIARGMPQPVQAPASSRDRPIAIAT